MELPVPVESHQFTQLSCEIIEERINKMTPKQLLAAFSIFDDDEVKDRLMYSAIEAFKSLQIDIRHFNMRELSTLIGLVAKHSSADLY